MTIRFILLVSRQGKVRLTKFYEATDTKTRGKLIRAFDESIGAFDRAHAAGGLRLDAIDFGRRAAVERELEGARVALSRSGAVFDETGHFLA